MEMPIGTWANNIKDTRDVVVASAYGRDFIQDTLASADIHQVPKSEAPSWSSVTDCPYYEAYSL